MEGVCLFRLLCWLLFGLRLVICLIFGFDDSFVVCISTDVPRFLFVLLYVFVGWIL